jgi:dTMP kinase
MGRFIVIEGADGAGTTTQAKLIAAALRCSFTSEPTEGPIGKLIRGYLGSDKLPPRHTMELLFRADRIEHVRNFIQPELDAGRTVICDRYYPSTLVYQTIDEEPPEERVQSMVAMMLRGDCILRPDLILFLDADTDILAERIRQRGAMECYEKKETLGKVVAGYRAWFNSKVFTDHSVRIDAAKPLSDVRTDCLRAIREAFDDVETTEEGGTP